jgi:hypothetical protein
MGYAILWLSHLGFVLFLISAVCALAARCQKSIWRKFWPVLAAILGVLSTAVYGAFGGFFLKQNVQPKWLFWYGLALFLVSLGGSVMILRYSRKKDASGNALARSWHRLPLTVAALVFLLTYCSVINAIDMRMLNRSTRINLSASAALMNLLPAKLPDSLNARLLYEQAARFLGKEFKDARWLTDSDKSDFDVTTHEVVEVLNASQRVLKLVHEAAALPDYGLNSDMSNFYRWPIPKYSNYRDFGRLLTLSAKVKALNGDLNGALEELDTMKKMTSHFSKYPILISFMISRAIDKERMAGLEYVLAHTDALTVDRRLLPIHVPNSVLPEFRRTIQVEAKGLLQGFALLAGSENPLSESGVFQPTISIDTIFAPFWRVYMLPSDLKSAYKISKLMSREAVSYEEIEDIFNKINESAEAGEFGILTAIATPAYLNYVVRARQFDAQRNLEALALAVSAYRSDKGKYPLNIDYLVPKYLDRVPPDPFAAKQLLQMKAVSGGLDLFSKGSEAENKVSDSGPIHFYIGMKAYDQFRVKPAQEESRRIKEKRKKRKK